jgi:hypothetical protein
VFALPPAKIVGALRVQRLYFFCGVIVPIDMVENTIVVENLQ